MNGVNMSSPSRPKRRVTKGLLAMATLFLPALLYSQELLDLAAETPRLGVEIAGKRGLEASRYQVPVKVLLPEFEQAQIDLEYYVPENSSAKEIAFTFTSLPGIHPDKEMRKTLTVSSTIPKAASAWRTMSVNFDSNEFLKIGNPPFPLELTCLSIRHKQQVGGSDKIYLGALRMKRKGVFCSLETGMDIAVYDMNKMKNPPRLRISNGGPDSAAVELSYAVHDVDGDIHDSGTLKTKLGPEDSKALDLKRPGKYGVQYLEYAVSREGATAPKRTRKISYAAMNPTGIPDKLFNGDFLFSICAHLMYYCDPETEKMVEYIALCGANHVRAATGWPRVQPEKDVWDFHKSDSVLELLTKNNIEREESFVWAPEWAVDPEWKKKGFDGIAYPQREAYAEWLGRFASRLKGKVRMFEIINEANYTKWTPEQYIEFQKLSYAELKKANPDALLLSGSWGGVIPTIPWQKKLYEAAPNTSDIIAVHHHCPFELDINPVKAQVALLRQYGIKQPWFSNETAWTSVDDACLANNLFKKLIYVWANGSIGYTWYNLRNKGWNPTNGEHNFGLLTQDLYPRAAYVTFNMLTGVFRGAKFVSELDMRPDIYAFRFEDQQKAMIPFWNMSRDLARQALAFQTDAESVELIDLYGNISRLPVHDKVIVVAVTGTPATLRLTPAHATLKYIGPLAELECKLAVFPDAENEFKLELFNPFSAPETICAKLTDPNGASVSPAEFKATVQAGTKAEFVARIKAGKDFDAATKPPATLRADLRFPCEDVAESVAFNVQPVLKLQKDGKVRFACERREQYTSLVPVVPQNAHLFWTGVGDLCAWINIYYPSTDTLRVQVCVIDNIHYQPFHGVEMYKGDNLQLMFLFPNQKSQWEIGVSRYDGGAHESYVWMAPDGVDPREVGKSLKIRSTAKAGDPLWYEISIPLKSVGTSFEDLQKYGFRFNAMINDNDGSLRKGFMSNITGDPKDVNNFPVILLK